MAEFGNKEHHFVHKDVQPTEPVKGERFLARLKRESEEAEGIMPFRKSITIVFHVVCTDLRTLETDTYLRNILDFNDLHFFRVIRRFVDEPKSNGRRRRGKISL